MIWKNFLLRFAGLIAFAVLGGMLFAITVNLLVMAGLTPTGEQAATDYGDNITMDAAFVYMISLFIGFGGIFVRDTAIRWVLSLCPLYATSLFAIVYTLVQPQ